MKRRERTEFGTGDSVIEEQTQLRRYLSVLIPGSTSRTNKTDKPWKDGRSSIRESKGGRQWGSTGKFGSKECGQPWRSAAPPHLRLRSSGLAVSGAQLLNTPA